VVLTEGFYEGTGQCICGGVREKDDVEAEGVMVSEGCWAGQTG